MKSALLTTILGSTLLLSPIVEAQQAETRSFDSVSGDPIEFVPFKITDFCRIKMNGSCQEHYSSPDQIFSSAEVYQGTIGQYVDFLNMMERLHNVNGHTLRPESTDAEDEVHRPYEVPTSARELEGQLLALLDLNTEAVLEKVLGFQLSGDCPLLPHPGQNMEYPNYQYPRFSLPGINDLPYDRIIDTFNENQKIFCSIGMSLYKKLDPNEALSPKVLLDRLVLLRDELLDELGLSGYAGNLSLETVQRVQAGIDIAKEIYDAIRAKEFPSPEKLFEMREKLNIVIPEGWEIPDIPNIPSPTPPERRDLSVKKRKDWSGFSYGKRDRFATYANAYLELAGSEEAQASTAFGAAGIYILDREINALGAYVQAYAGPDEVSLNMEMKIFGQDVFDKVSLKESVKIIIPLPGEKRPTAFDFRLDRSYQETFMAGPIPISVTLGALIDLGLAYEYGIYTTKLKGSAIPYISAEAYASGEAGIPNLLSVGAQASLKVIDLKAPISGYTGINFDEVGYPFLKLAIDSSIDYTAVKGRTFAYANYLVPRFGLPPVKKKTSEYDIFNWKGYSGNHQVMNWGLEIGRNGTKLTGNLLDQTDRKESQDLQNQIDLESRRDAIAEYQNKAHEKTRLIFQGIQDDLLSDQNLQIFTFKNFLDENDEVAAEMVREYTNQFNQLFSSRIQNL